MKSIVLGLALCVSAFPALAQTNVSVSIGQPGFYGRIDVGDFAPRPVLYGPRPVIIAPGPHYVAEPVYLRVPVDHRRHWSRYCGRYGACGRPVLFVRDDWYRNTYVPRWREHYHGRPVRVVERVEYRDHGPRPHHDRGRHEGWDRGHGHGGPRHDGGPHHGGGPGRGDGPGHGHGHGR